MGTGSSPQFDFGHWVLRLIALIIDGIIFAIISFILSLLLFVPLLFTGALFVLVYLGVCASASIRGWHTLGALLRYS
jgi:uncharacterized RDD family membrane protein YckC